MFQFLPGFAGILQQGGLAPKPQGSRGKPKETGLYEVLEVRPGCDVWDRSVKAWEIGRHLESSLFLGNLHLGREQLGANELEL